MKEFKTAREIIALPQLETGTSSRQIDDVAIDGQCLGAEQKLPNPRDQTPRRRPHPATFVRSAHGEAGKDKNLSIVYIRLITDLLRAREPYLPEIVGYSEK